MLCGTRAKSVGLFKECRSIRKWNLSLSTTHSSVLLKRMEVKSFGIPSPH